MATNYLFLSTGFEEVEALAPLDVLRRAGIDVCSVSMEGSLAVRGSHGVTVEADMLFDVAALEGAEYLILPGGSTRLNEFEELKKALLKHVDEGGSVAAICAAPMVLGGLGLLAGKEATCYPGFEGYLTGATFVDRSVVLSGTTITANGAGSAIEFALALVAQIKGKEVADSIAKAMMVR